MKNIILLVFILFVLNEKALSAFRTLEADYITNVFSQSNFVKNPNARVNTQNITASAGFTVARSITTPLYDMSEFLLSSTGTSGTIDWATRTLDVGMKGQNCEARFTYRGFTGGTTKAQIVQGASTVATLDLVASTDPKQVSINFPCGDLTQATVFRINRTVAAFSGTNEIGGIYLGLATNMANVAQAEFVGSWRMVGASGCTFGIISTSFQQFPVTSACNSPVTTGSVLATQGKRPWIDISNPKSGNYYVVAKGSFHNPAANQNQYMRLTAIKSAGNESSSQLRTYAGTSSAIFPASLSMNTSFSSGTLGFTIEGLTSNAASAIQLINDGPSTDITFEVYRFPTASELVVRPETQSVFYVQGPVLGAQTGAVIPSGYVGESFSENGTTNMTISTSSAGTSTTLATKAIGAGSWLLIPSIHCKETSAMNSANVGIRIGAFLSTSSVAFWPVPLDISDGAVGFTQNFGNGSEFSVDVSGVPLFVSLSSPTTYYLRGSVYNNLSGGSGVCRGSIKGIRLN